MGESFSFKRELIAHIPALRAFAVSLCGKFDVADDLVQDTVLNAWAKQHSFQEGTNLKAWLFTILRNLFYSRMRKRGREVQDSDGVFSANLAVPPARGGHSGWSIRNELRRSSSDLWLCSWHYQEQGQQGEKPASGTAFHYRFRGVWAGRQRCCNHLKSFCSLNEVFGGRHGAKDKNRSL